LVTIPKCPEQLPEILSNKLREFAEAWKLSPIRPDCTAEAKKYWDSLISKWAKDPNLPLFVRKQGDHRGQSVIHDSGRELILTDNSPAQWVYSLCYQDKRYKLRDIQSLLLKDEVPVAALLRPTERGNAKYKCTLSSLQGDLVLLGWKLAHVNSSGLRTSKRLEEQPIASLMTHFVRSMSPSNMILLPKNWAGVADTPEMVSVFSG
jgi:hypothetical protein